MNRDSPLYLAAHYLALIGLVFASIVAIETLGADLPFWAGLLLAILIGVGYPRVVQRVGVAPERWS